MFVSAIVRHRLSQRILAGALVLALSACGFHLRGTSSVPLALSPLKLECQVAASLCNPLRQQLKASGVTLQDAAGNAYRLAVRDLQASQRATALTSDASAAEFELTSSVEMALFAPDGLPLRAPTRLNTSQTYRFDDTQVLAGQQERQELEKTLHRQLAQQVIFALGPFDAARIQRIQASQEASSGNAD